MRSISLKPSKDRLPCNSWLHLLNHSSAAQAKRAKRKAKAGNKFGDPIALKSKILAAVEDPFSSYISVFVALSAGGACRVNLEVCAQATESHRDTRLRSNSLIGFGRHDTISGTNYACQLCGG